MDSNDVLVMDRRVRHIIAAERLVPRFASGRYDQLRSCFERGNDLMRFPVAANTALHNAGGAGGSAGSPRPVTGESESFQ